MSAHPKSFGTAAAALREQEFARLAAAVVPTLESLRSLTPEPFRAQVATMLERFSYELVTGEKTATLVAVKDGRKYIIAVAPPAEHAPTSIRELARLHAAVVANNAAAGFFVTSRSFTPDAEAYAATAPLKLVDGAKLLASIQRSMADVVMPQTYKAMCRCCGDIVLHRLDRAEAIPCRDGHPVAPTIARAALIAPPRSVGSPGRGELRPPAKPAQRQAHNARYRKRVWRKAQPPHNA
jgi:hypothetical protein